MLLAFRVTHDVTGQVKVQRFCDLPCLVLSRTTTVSNGNTSLTACIVSGILLSNILCLILCLTSYGMFKVKVIQGNDVRERSKWKLWTRLVWCMFLDHLFINNTKNGHRTLLRGSIRKKIGKNRNPRKQCRMWPFSAFRISKLGHFQHIHI